MKPSDKQPDALAAPSPVEGPKFTQAEYEAFMQEQARINEDEPGLLTPEHLNGLQASGYDFHNEVGAKMIKDGAADVVAYLSSERGQADRCALLNVIDSKARSIAEYERIRDMVRRNGLYQKPVFVRSENAATDEYLVQRRRDFMHGIRRAR